MKDYARGSEWRKWDLHIHTASSYDAYKGDDSDKLLAKAVCENELAAIAITDHFIIDKDRITNIRGLLPSTTIFPGVELRTDKGDTNIHVILIFSDQIDLNTLSEDFNVFKRDAKNPDNNDKIYWDYNDICAFAQKHNALISIHAGSKDKGVDTQISNALPINQAVKEEFAKTVSIFEVGKEKDIDDYKKYVFPDIKSTKPLIICSDSHDPRNYHPAHQLWIKSDPTFNGLKQIIYEPDERVCISDYRPQEKAPYHIIDSISISDDLFQKDEIVFNKNLTCIIGGKSTGKSILLHNLARAIDPDQVSENSDISLGRRKTDKDKKALTLEIESSKLDVKWGNGKSGENQSIIYIPQSYLNRLADSSQETTRIDELVERVLLKRTDTDGNKLQKQKDALIQSLNDKKTENTNTVLEIVRLNESIKQLKSQISELGGRDSVEKEIHRLKTERDAIAKELNITEEDIKKYDQAVSTITAKEAFVEEISKEIKSISSLSSVVQSSIDLSSFSKETEEQIEAIVQKIIGEANRTWNVQKEQLIAFLSEKLKIAEKECVAALATRDSLKGKIESSNHIKELAQKISDEEAVLQTIISKEKVLNDEQEKQDIAISNISSSCVDFKKYYEDYACYISENANTDDSGLTYEVLIPLRVDDFLNKWRELFRENNPQNRKLIDTETFSDSAFTKELLAEIIKKDLSGELTTLKAGENTENTLRSILTDWYNIKYVVKMGDDSVNVMSPGKKALVLLQLLIDLDETDCPILIDQPEDDLDNRSIFEQLIPFIKKKKAVRQIIVVTHNANIVIGADAEEVIIANQNGTDSPNKDSVHFSYRSGSIENDYPLLKENGSVEDGILAKQGIQQHICDILEGGEKAFEKRKNKYNLNS